MLKLENRNVRFVLLFILKNTLYIVRIDIFLLIQPQGIKLIE